MKRLELEIVNIERHDDHNHFVVRIKTQTHILENFGKNGSEIFVAKNGVSLSSVGSPQWKPYEKRLFLRGYNHDKDQTTILILERDYYDIKDAVDEYNRIFAFEKGGSPLEDSLFEVV